MSLPDIDTEVYNRLRKLAADQLDDPVTARITQYDDGTYQMVVSHLNPVEETKESLNYHSEQTKVVYGVKDIDSEEILRERVIETI